MKITKAQKFAFSAVGAILLFMVYLLYFQNATINWNNVVTDLFTTTLGAFIAMSLTVLAYRFMYHRRSKR